MDSVDVASSLLVAAGFGLLPIIVTGLAIGVMGYGMKRGIDYLFKK